MDYLFNSNYSKHMRLLFYGMVGTLCAKIKYRFRGDKGIVGVIIKCFKYTLYRNVANPLGWRISILYKKRNLNELLM